MKRLLTKLMSFNRFHFYMNGSFVTHMGISGVFALLAGFSSFFAEQPKDQCAYLREWLRDRCIRVDCDRYVTF